MKIGLVRHFRVMKDYPGNGRISQTEVMKWFEDYDTADIEYGEVDLGGIEWKRCFASILPRAVKTAEKFHASTITILEELREIRIYPFFNREVTLPAWLWPVFLRIAWLMSHKSQLDSRKDVEKRVKFVLDRILAESNEDVLIVSHGALMIFLRKELIRRGFKGPSFGRAENGKLYVFENPIV